jgi:hypothetical protein
MMYYYWAQVMNAGSSSAGGYRRRMRMLILPGYIYENVSECRYILMYETVGEIYN